MISSVSALFITLVSIPLLITIKKKIRILSFVIDKVSYIGLSLPGIIVSMSLVFFCINYFDYIYQTFIVLVLGYFISFLPDLLKFGPIVSNASITLNGKLNERFKYLSDYIS